MSDPWYSATAIYDGPIKHLRLKKALLVPGTNEDVVLAQFDALHLVEAFGWREFPRKDFVNFEVLNKKESS